MDTMRIFAIFGTMAFVSTLLFAVLVRRLSYTHHLFTHFLVVIGSGILLSIMWLSVLWGMLTSTQALFVTSLWVFGGLSNFLEYEFRYPYKGT